MEYLLSSALLAFLRFWRTLSRPRVAVRRHRNAVFERRAVCILTAVDQRTVLFVRSTNSIAGRPGGHRRYRNTPKWMQLRSDSINRPANGLFNQRPKHKDVRAMPMMAKAKDDLLGVCILAARHVANLYPRIILTPYKLLGKGRDYISKSGDTKTGSDSPTSSRFADASSLAGMPSASIRRSDRQ
jgi:hypothetical protein